MNLSILFPGVRAARRLILVLLCSGAFTAGVRADEAPTITSFSPTSGPVGSSVIIEGTGFVAPFSVTFSGNVQAAGSFTSTQITVTVPFDAQTGPITVTTANGSVSTATDFTVGAANVPTATLAATVPTTRVGSTTPGEFTISLSSAATTKLVVQYTVAGSAVNGTDDTLLTGTVKIKPGKTSKVIDVVGQGDLGGAAKKTVKLTLATGDGYTVGTTTPTTVKIKAAQ